MDEGMWPSQIMAGAAIIWAIAFFIYMIGQTIADRKKGNDSER